ncbi:MAG: hypothetical protein QOI08_2450 [Actinomycetota bacterium]|nr:hypothetical protein [Actinomycetota bacterium]
MKRKLTIRTKLAATLAVPLAALASFAALQARAAYTTSAQVKLQAGLATSATGPAGLLNALENERDFESLRAIGAQNLVAPKDAKNSAQVTARSDLALSTFRSLLRNIGGAAAGNYPLSQVSAALVGLRQQAEDNATRASTPENAKHATIIFDRYTALIGRLLDADQRSGATIDDSQLRSGAELLNAIARQSDTESGVGIKVGLAAMTRDPAALLEVQRLADRQAQGDADLQVRADGPYDRAISAALDAPARKKAVAQLQNAARHPLSANLLNLLKVRPDSIELLHIAQSNTAGIVSEQSISLTSAAQDEERNWIAITAASVLLAIALLYLTNRWITRPLRALADQATSMAGKRLPAAVQEILETPVNETVVQPEVAPVRVYAGGEVHDVEVALNKVQDSAVSLAVQQATLRRSVADAYVNLGRRNQNLLSRQLEFISQLENDESDPETLEHLFRLDHLATRMRRNAESLLVLAGLAPPRTWSAPVAMGDVVRGALGEVEGYRRVRLRHVDDARVDGAAAADVSHVIAELVENALSFSPPDADVEVYGRRDDHGYVITIVDSGIGMHEEELGRANSLISSANALTLAPSRFLGHYVVAQLAARHGLTVHLAASPAGGLTAMVALPGVLLGLAPAPAVDEAVVETPPAASEEVDRPAPALPRRGPVADPASPAPTDAPPAPAAVAPPAPAPRPEPEPAREPAAPIAFRASVPAPPVAPEAPTDADVAPVAAVTPADVPVEIDVTAPPERDVPVADWTAHSTPTVPEVAPEPAPPARPRLGIGSFADLRGATPMSTPGPADASVAPAASSADTAPSPDPDRPTTVAPDRRASFAEVAQAVDVAAGRPAEPGTGSPFSEDLIPQRLPKRGRRNSRLETPWARERPAPAPLPVAPPAASPTQVAAPAAPLPSRNGSTEQPNGPAAPTVSNGAHVPEGGSGAPAPNTGAGDGSAGSGERFAFFAAFRAAAEQAREEAGIDDRRGH